MLRPQSIKISIKNRIVLCLCGDIETEIHLFFYCNFHYAARAILSNRVWNILTDNKSPEIFDCLSNVELLRIFLFGLPDDEPSHISVAAFCAVDDFLKSSNRFWRHPRDLVHHLWEIRAFLLHFCWYRSVAIIPIRCAWCVDLRFRCCIYCVYEFPEVLYQMLAMQCIRFCISVWFLILLALYFQSSTWHDRRQHSIIQTTAGSKIVVK